MDQIMKLFEKFAEYYGHTASVIIMIAIGVLYGVYIILKNYSSLIKSFFEKKMKEEEEAHAKATILRKTITPKIRQLLSNLAVEIDADRVVLLEFSNGNSNLVGLPFLYLSATCEVVTRGTSVISPQYQRMNVSLVADFIEKLEDKGYYYFKNIEEIKDSFPTLYMLMKANGVHTGLFYTISGVKDIIGIIVASTIGDKEFSRDKSLPQVASASQIISSYLNFDVLHEEL